MAPRADGFEAAVAPHRRELMVHCYRMLGSVDDAEDALQDTMARAWRAFDRHHPARASLRTWLYRIATNVCLTAARSRARHPLPADVGPRFDDPEAPFAPGLDVPWLQPMPDVVLGAPSADPAEAAAERDRLRLAVVAALQLLPPRPRAALLLREVLGLPAREVAAVLGTTPVAVDSALQRARATLATADPEPSGTVEAEQRVVAEWMAAFEAADVAALTALVRDDVVLEMPPTLNWYRGSADHAAFMARIFRRRGTRWRMAPAGANRQAATTAHLGDPDGDPRPHAVSLLTVDADSRIARITVFQDPEVLARFTAHAPGDDPRDGSGPPRR